MTDTELKAADTEELKAARVDQKKAKTTAAQALSGHRQLLIALAEAERSIVRAARRRAVHG